MNRLRAYFGSDAWWDSFNGLPGRAYEKIQYDWKLGTRLHVIKIALTPHISDLKLETIYNGDYFEYAMNRAKYASRVEAAEELHRLASRFYADNPEGMLLAMRSLAEGSRRVYRMIDDEYRQEKGIRSRDGEDDM